jgi:hypothetical protein
MLFLISVAKSKSKPKSKSMPRSRTKGQLCWRNVLTNMPELIVALHGTRCTCTVQHQHIEGYEGGEKRSKWAQKYTAEFVDAILGACRAQLI